MLETEPLASTCSSTSKQCLCVPSTSFWSHKHREMLCAKQLAQSSLSGQTAKLYSGQVSIQSEIIYLKTSLSGKTHAVVCISWKIFLHPKIYMFFFFFFFLCTCSQFFERKWSFYIEKWNNVLTIWVFFNRVLLSLHLNNICSFSR